MNLIAVLPHNPSLPSTRFHKWQSTERQQSYPNNRTYFRPGALKITVLSVTL